MRLLEFESKLLFSEFGIPVPKGKAIADATEVKQVWNELKTPLMFKAQVAIGGRGKAGLIKRFDSLDSAEKFCSSNLRRKIDQYTIEKILVEETAKIENELYCAITQDASKGQYVVIISAEGGIDIEEVAEKSPEAIKKVYVDLDEGLTEKIILNLSEVVSSEYRSSFGTILEKLWQITIKRDAQLVEINPLAITDKGLIALDAKIILDDNAAFRQPLIQELSSVKKNELEKTAAEAGFSYVTLEGDIGILANGAGLTMALLDMLSERNLKAANFLDVGGGAGPERVFKALDLLVKQNVNAILINIYGGITRCDDVAKGIVQAVEQFKGSIPSLFIRLSGTNEEEGRQILEKAGMSVFSRIADAVAALEALKN
ncbi:MAG: ADP-forming succinate--CoA ligase subunit beta [Promethearchaeota archaeon]